MKKIALLGGTGSIGIQTVDVIKENKEQFELFAFSFGTNVDVALTVIEELKPKYIVTKDKDTCDKVKNHLTYKATCSYGLEAISEIATHPEVQIVVNALLGSVGLQPTLDAIRAKKKIAFANKETLVTAGHIVMDEVKKYEVDLLPVDSEHAAIHQCLASSNMNDVKRIILTASGGSFRDLSREELSQVTRKDALKHPNWDMGAKITIDSATMMNKGLEVIEAHWLFSIPYEQIEVILHRESVIHSMVEFVDRSVLAQLGTPDMRIPIQYAIAYPERIPFQLSDSLDFASLGKLHFEKMSFERFPSLKMAYEAGKTGGSMPTVLNAANEVAVELFLKEKINFLQIERIIAEQLESHQVINTPDLETIVEIDRQVRVDVFKNAT